MKNNVFQIMRGICIIAVILTHVIDKNFTNPNYEIALIIQNIINIAVTGFIFLMGYFINIEEATTNTKHFIIRKSQRIFIPYFLWSIFYVLLRHQSYTLWELLNIFLLGQASAPLYYCVLYFLFILITPFVVKRMKHKIWNIVFWSIMPVWFLVVYYLQMNYQIAYSTWIIIPFTWFLYFYIGLKWRNVSIKLSVFTIIALICLGYFIQFMETIFLLSITNDPAFSATPIRFSAILYVILIILLFLKLKNTNISKANILVLLANNSLGIYLSHMAVLFFVKSVVNKIFEYSNTIQYIIYVLTILLITVLTTNMLINICKKFMPRTFLKWIGFT